jgi:hypothetical protein
MKQKLCLLMLAALVVMLAYPVCGQTILMANPSGIAERDIAVYYPNGTMQGLWNSTSTIVLDSSSDYIFTMKPLQTNPLEDPGNWLTSNVFPFVSTNVLALLVIIVLAAVWYRGR